MLTFIQAVVRPAYENGWTGDPVELTPFGTKFDSSCSFFQIIDPNDFVKTVSIYYTTDVRVQEIKFITN